MIGIIDVGGGMRDVYGAGIFDYCLNHNIKFPYCIGVSAGSGNIASYLGNQPGRNLRFYKDYIDRKEYMSVSNFIHNGSYIDLDYVYSTMSNEDGEDPLDMDTILNCGSIMKVVTTNAKTGEPEYFETKDFVKNDYGMLKASCCIPIVCKPYLWHGQEYFDGGVADPIPIKKAFEDGCEKVVLILTKPVDYREGKDRDLLSFKILKKKYPNVYKKLQTEHARYNETLDEVINKYLPTGRVLILAPDDCCNVNTLTRKPDRIQKLYEKGYKDGKLINEFIKMS